MNELEQLRQQIDAVDRQLLPLFLERMELCSKVADYKRAARMPVLDAKREAEVLANKLELLPDAEKARANEVYEFFRSIMAISRILQTRELGAEQDRIRIEKLLEGTTAPKESPTVCYFGSEGSYSEEAAISYFGEGAERFSVRTFREAFAMLREEKADYLVLPMENSSTGTIAEVLELLLQYGYYLVGEEKIAIHHCLLGIKGATTEDIRKVYSHQQGILQCAEFLRTLPHAECVEYDSTALSAKTVAERKDKSLAAIASKRNATLLGLEILAEDINSSAVNTTRFGIIARKPEIDESCDKVSIAFTLPHESGQLHRLLACFAQAGLNLLKLESRPIPSEPFAYMFLADYTANLLNPDARDVTDSVIEGTKEFTFLGNYRSKESREQA